MKMCLHVQHKNPIKFPLRELNLLLPKCWMNRSCSLTILAIVENAFVSEEIYVE